MMKQFIFLVFAFFATGTADHHESVEKAVFEALYEMMKEADHIKPIVTCLNKFDKAAKPGWDNITFSKGDAKTVPIESACFELCLDTEWNSVNETGFPDPKLLSENIKKLEGNEKLANYTEELKKYQKFYEQCVDGTRQYHDIEFIPVSAADKKFLEYDYSKCSYAFKMSWCAMEKEAMGQVFTEEQMYYFYRRFVDYIKEKDGSSGSKDEKDDGKAGEDRKDGGDRKDGKDRKDGEGPPPAED